MKRDLFVFAGQSNMMGASVYEPQRSLSIKDSYEYKHKFKRLGEAMGRFVTAGYPVGEFAYTDLALAYGADMVNENGQSLLNDYASNTYFCPSMSNLKSEEERSVYPFATFSEVTARSGATLAPFLAEKWEALGNRCAYAHIAQGGVSIDYYMTDDMIAEYAQRLARYNRENGTDYDAEVPAKNRKTGAPEYFFEKCKDFFADAETRFSGEDLSNRCFFWIQGESDTKKSAAEYEIKLSVIWDRLKAIGFTHFFCIRIDYFGAENIYRVMQAQENFVLHHPDAYMLTRIASYFTHPEQNDAEWFLTAPTEECRNCRDSFYGYQNQHINEKGFFVIAEHAVKNLSRVLIQNEEPILEEENVRLLITEK